MEEKLIKFSSEELQEFKAVINKKLTHSQNQLSLLKKSLSYASSNDTSTDLRGYEDASRSFDREYTAQQIYRMEKFIQNLEAALVRIANGPYGICRKTGKIISRERLLQVPHTPLTTCA